MSYSLHIKFYLYSSELNIRSDCMKLDKNKSKQIHNFLIFLEQKCLEIKSTYV